MPATDYEGRRWIPALNVSIRDTRERALAARALVNSSNQVIYDADDPPSGGGASAYRLGPFKIGAWDGQYLGVETNQTVSGGTFTVTYKGQTTPALAFDISTSDLQTALEGLSTIGIGNVRRITNGVGGIGAADPYGVFFEPTQVTELLTVDGTNLTGPDAPYTGDGAGATNWATELFTPSVGDTILDFQFAVPEAFDSMDTPTLFYADSIESTNANWKSAGPSTDMLSKLDTSDSFTNFYGSLDTDAGYQRSLREMIIAYAIDAQNTPLCTVPIVCITPVPIYAYLQGIIEQPTTGSVWIWVDIAPATAP